MEKKYQLLINLMEKDLSSLKAEMLDTVENNILPFWLNKMQDVEQGGFYGQMRGDGTLVKEADKGCILNARILWSFSAAYRVLRKPEYLAAATRAKDYILQHFIDREFGGAYWSLMADGTPLDTKKQFYAIGFVIYGLTEYSRATHDLESLNLAIDLYHSIEDHSFDQQFNGYIEACTREWGEISDMRLSDLDANFPKSQNTHLHIIEPYTNLYRVLKSLSTCEKHAAAYRDITAEVEERLRNLISIFTDKILNPETHHLDLFFEMDWTRAGASKDCSEQLKGVTGEEPSPSKNGWRLESYGHDIECSWLMHEAALVLGDKEVLAKVEPIVKLVAKASEKGLNADGSMTHEANLDTGHVDDDRHWWVQAESVVGFFNIYQYFGDEEALQKSLRGWQYIKDNLIDHEMGEWYWSRDPQGNINLKDDHAGFWKCPYHNSRMCLELIERIDS